MDNHKPIVFNNFSGGYCGNLAPDVLQPNQASDLDNVVIQPTGFGYTSRLGNTKLNASAINSGNIIQGLGYLSVTTTGSSFLGAVSATKFYTSSNGGSTFSDSTGAIIITSGADNRWSFCTFQDTLVAFGGPPLAPNAPFKWTGSGNAAVLGGSPPSAHGCFSINNRVFAYRTATNPSTIYWSIIGSAEDWTSSGSGSAVVGSFSDNQALVGAQVLSANYVLLFKQNSTYQMNATTSPFPIYTLFDKIGCISRDASINVEGRVYWINQFRRMVSTNGEDYKTYPPVMDDLWNNLLPAANKNKFFAFRAKTDQQDWLVWVVTTSGTANNIALIWDLNNNCWLRCTTGFTFNAVTADINGAPYCGDYAGFVYTLFTPSKYADDSEASPGTIASYWRSGWINPGVSSDEIVQVRKAIVNFKCKLSGSLTLNYGFDFLADTGSATISHVATSTETFSSRQAILTGHGNYFQFKLGISSSTFPMQVNSITLKGKVFGQRKISST